MQDSAHCPKKKARRRGGDPTRKQARGGCRVPENAGKVVPEPSAASEAKAPPEVLMFSDFHGVGCEHQLCRFNFVVH